MKLVILVIGMALAAYLTSMYLTTPSIATPDGRKAPEQILDKVKADTSKIEKDMAKRAAAPPPSE